MITHVGYKGRGDSGEELGLGKETEASWGSGNRVSGFFCYTMPPHEDFHPLYLLITHAHLQGRVAHDARPTRTHSLPSLGPGTGARRDITPSFGALLDPKQVPLGTDDGDPPGLPSWSTLCCRPTTSP